MQPGATTAAPTLVGAEPCRHDDVDDLGRDGPTRFYRCRACASLVLVQGRERWEIRAAGRRAGA